MKTPLYAYHVQSGAKMAKFAGWEMPISYQGICKEHLLVRNSCGVFDVSHMGQLAVEGEGASALLDFLSTRPIASRPVGSATYTVWCNAEGGVVDDVIVLRLGETRFLAVVNASNRKKDREHLVKYAGESVRITCLGDTRGILAVQGPESPQVLKELFPTFSPLLPMRCTELVPEQMLVASTGYTGEVGYEILASKPYLIACWEKLIELGVPPIGLGARDTLRLEMGYALYGQELDEVNSPLGSVAAWTVKEKEHGFLGKGAKPNQKKAYGVVLQERGVPRRGNPILFEGQVIGEVTSGTFSPSLQQGIALVTSLYPLTKEQGVDIDIRGRRVTGKVASLPFYQRKRL